MYKNWSQPRSGLFSHPAASRHTEDMSTFFKLLVLICLQRAVSARVMDAESLEAAPEKVSTVTIDTCKTCTEIFDRLKDLLSDAGVQGKIEHDVEVLCGMLGNPALVKLCKQTVEKSLSMAFSLLGTAINPGKICSALGLCVVEVENKLQGLMAKLQTAFQSPDLEVDSDLQCKFCVYLIELLETLLPIEKTETTIAQLLEHVCDLLPTVYKDQCEAFIEQYSKKLIELLLGKSTPHAICTLIHLCKGMETPITGSYMSGYACTMSSYRCKNLLTALECGAVEFCQKHAWL